MDGVIIDSEPQHGRAALKVLHKYGADADMSYHEQFIGSSTANMAQKVISDFSLSLSPEELLAELNQAKREIHKEEGYPSLPGICELIPKLAASGWKLAIASSSNPAEINAVVSSLGIRKYFDQLVSSSNVAHPKPAPDTFQLLSLKTLLMVSKRRSPPELPASDTTIHIPASRIYHVPMFCWKVSKDLLLRFSCMFGSANKKYR